MRVSPRILARAYEQQDDRCRLATIYSLQYFIETRFKWSFGFSYETGRRCHPLSRVEFSWAVHLVGANVPGADARRNICARLSGRRGASVKVSGEFTRHFFRPFERRLLSMCPPMPVLTLTVPSSHGIS